MQPTLPVKRQHFRRRQLPRRIIPPHPTRPRQPGHPLQRQVNAIRLHLLRRIKQTLHQRRPPLARLLNQAAQSRPLQNPPSQRLHLSTIHPRTRSARLYHSDHFIAMSFRPQGGI